MSVMRLLLYMFFLLAAITVGAWLLAVAGLAQTATREKLRPDNRRITFAASQKSLESHARPGGYVPQRAAGRLEIRSHETNGTRAEPVTVKGKAAGNDHTAQADAAAATIAAGTPLHRVLHTAQMSLTSSAGTNEELVDTNGI